MAEWMRACAWWARPSRHLFQLFVVFIGLALPLSACDGASPTATRLSTATATLPPLTETPTLPPTLTATATPPPTPTLVVPTATPLPPESPAWFYDAVLYEIFVRSFYDSDGDGVGDLAGVTAQLDYLESLGVTAIWLMPIHPSPSYHGYDVTDYFDVNPDYGTLDDLRRLVDGAHARDIKIILDFVVNHTSNQAPFFLDAMGNPDSEYADWFNWTNETHTRWEGFAGLDFMPTFNHDSEGVQAFVKEIARFWLDLDGDGDYRDGVDGFRCDVAVGPPHRAWKMLRQEVKALNPNALLLGEAWLRNPVDMRNYFNQEFDALFDFPLYHTLAGDHDANGDGVLNGEGRAGLVHGPVLSLYHYFPHGQMARFINNHDTNRAMTDLQGDERKARGAAALLMTLPSTPMIYYGEEIGMAGAKGFGPVYDELRREPMDWYAAEEGPGMPTWFKPGNRNNAPHDGVSVEEQTDDPGSLLNHYRQLAALRHAYPALRTGGYQKVSLVGNPDGQAACWRWDEGAAILVVWNLSDASARVSVDLTDRPSRATGPVTDLLTGQVQPDPEGDIYPVRLDAWEVRVLRWSPYR
jgi:alpha-amylase